MPTPTDQAPLVADEASAAGASAAGGASALVKRGNRPPETVAFEICVVSFFVDAAEVLGIPKSVAAIYGTCFASPRPLSFADIEDRLDLSKGSISQGMRVLREIGAIIVVETQDRRDFFEPDLELRKVATHFIEQRLERHLTAGRGRLQEMSRLLPGPAAGAAGARVNRDLRELKGRLKYLQSWHDKGRALVPVMKAFLKLT